MPPTPARFLFPDLLDLVFGVKELGFGDFVCLEPVTNFDSADGFAIINPFGCFYFNLHGKLNLNQRIWRILCKIPIFGAV